MSLADRIAVLRAQTLGELDELEQYVSDTQLSWRLVQRLAGLPPAQPSPAQFGGFTILAESPIEFTVGSMREELRVLSGRSNRYTAGYLVEAAFQQSLAVFESFVADLLTVWLTVRPESLGGRDVKLIRVLRDGVETVVAEEVSQLVLATMTGGPRQWLDLLTQHAGIPVPAADLVARLVEAKATRDLLIHNRGMITPTYIKKAGPLARGADGERIEMPEPYRREVWALVRQLVADLSDAALANAAPDLPPPAAAG